MKKKHKKMKVKHCPFGHDEGKVGNLKVVKREGGYQVFCQFCGALGPLEDTPDKSVMAWQNRTMTVITQEQLNKLSKEMDDGRRSPEEPVKH